MGVIANQEDVVTYVVWPLLFNITVYWSVAAFWYCCDCSEALRDYRISRKKINWSLYKKSALHTAALHLFITPVALYCMIPAWKWRSESHMSMLSLVKLMLCPYIAEIVFFTTHFIGHYSIFFKHNHRLQNEWNFQCENTETNAPPIE